MKYSWRLALDVGVVAITHTGCLIVSCTHRLIGPGYCLVYSSSPLLFVCIFLPLVDVLSISALIKANGYIFRGILYEPRYNHWHAER